MIVQIKIEYNAKESIKKLSKEEYEKLKKLICGLPQDNDFVYGDYLMDEEGLAALLEVCSEGGIEIKKFKNTYSPNSIKNPLTAIEDIRNVVHVHIPNIGLLLINEVIVLEDVCTDVLQTHLNDGWRIVAICPPNGVRRPDYILGRTK